MKNIFLFVVFSSLSFIVKAQTKYSTSCHFGTTISNMTGAGAQNETFLNGTTPENFYANHPASSLSKLGVNFGITVDNQFSKYFSIGVGLGFIQKGAKIKLIDRWNSVKKIYQTISGKTHWNQNFLRIHTPLKLHIPIKRHKIYLKTAFSIDKLLSSKEKGDIQIAGQNFIYENEISNANSIEYCYEVGAGFVWNLANMKNGISFEANWGKSMLSTGREFDGANLGLSYNQTFSFLLAFSL